MRRTRGAERGAEFHQRLVPVACRTLVEKGVGSLLELRPASVGTKIAGDRAKASEDASHVAIENRESFSVSDAEDRRGSVGADAGKRECLLGGLRKNAVMFCDDFLRGFLEVARARVVTKPSPETKHFLWWSCGEGFNGRKTFEETLIVRNGGGNARLLQHDFREPNAVGIFVAAPGEITLELREPGEEVFAEAGK